MRKPILVILFFLFHFFSYSQNNFKPADSLSSWTGTTYGNMNGPNWWHFLTDSIVNDTVISAQNYIKLFRAGSNNQKNYFCSFRSDTLEKSIYIIPKDSTQEYLFFDFDSTINIGDQISIPFYGLGNFHYEVFELDAFADSFLLVNNEYYKLWSFWSNNYGPLYICERFICYEGFPFQINDFEWWTIEFKCYSENNVPVYGITCPYSYENFVSIKNIDGDDYDIFPNPTSNHVHLQFKGGSKKEINIRDYQGKLYFSTITNANNLTLDLADYASGLYFISVHDDSGMQIEKIIKE